MTQHVFIIATGVMAFTYLFTITIARWTLITFIGLLLVKAVIFT